MNAHAMTTAYKRFAITAAACITLILVSQQTNSAETLQPIPRASCGPNDRTESVQGQTTLAERFSPGPSKAFNCNLELIGQFEGEGAGVGFTAFKNCAYYSIMQNPQTRRPGVAVLSVSDERRPKDVNYLITEGMLGAFESVAVSSSSNLLIGSRMSLGAGPAPFDIYDLSAGCQRPKLLSSAVFTGLYSHAGDFTSDGRTYYGSKWQPNADPKAPPPAAVFAVDLAQPANPKLLSIWLPPKDWITHSAVSARGGSRVYVSIKRMAYKDENSRSPNGLAILDSSEILNRKPDGQFRLISTLFWDDSYASEGMQPLTIAGRPYLAFSDNLGSRGYKNPPPADACSLGKPTHGFARIIDLSDERSPRIASRLMLESAAPLNCEAVRHDPVSYGGYGSFGCTTDDPDNSRLLACSYFEAGLRVFDIRDPVKPREIAYYKPPARRLDAMKFPGSFLFTTVAPSGAQKPVDHTADSVIAIPRFREGGAQIWFTSSDNGFQTVRFSGRFRAANADLFED